MGKLTIHETPMNGLYVVETEPFVDHRGAFARGYCEEELAEVISERRIKNVNISRTAKAGSIHGMYFQRPPHAEMGMVRCIKGRGFDVTIDLQKKAETYLKWYGVELSETNMKLFGIPEGFAHGFQTSENNVEMHYLHTEFYNKTSEGAIRYNDPSVSIQWPKVITEVSEKDASYPYIDGTFSGVIL